MAASTTKNGSASRINGLLNGSTEKNGVVNQLVIPKSGMACYSFDIVGKTSLIVKSWSEKAIYQMLATQMGLAKPPKSRKSPEEEYAAARYTTEEGWDGINVGAFKSAMVNACRLVDGLPMTVAKRSIFIEADARCVKTVEVDGREYRQVYDVVRIFGEPQMRMDMARNDNGSADIRFRPEYLPWRATLKVMVNTSKLSVEQVTHLLATAGMSEGVGEQRPSAPDNHSGQNGMWTVVGYE